jgi:hypothetical protein
VWDCRDHRVITALQGPRAAIAAVRMDDERLVAAGHDGSVTIWDFASVDAAHIHKVRVLSAGRRPQVQPD